MSSASTPVSILVGRFRRLPRRDSHTWQGGIVRWPFWIESPDGGRPTRPWGAVWVTRPDGLIGVKVAELSAKPGAELAAAALVDLALRYQHQLMGRPGRIEVADAELGAAVVAALGDPGVAVDVVPELDDVKGAVAMFVARQGLDSGVPGMLSPRGVTVDDVREFAAAAERFHRAAPWQHLANEDVIGVEMPVLDKAARFAVVMGNAGMQFGIALYESMKAFEAMVVGGARRDGRSTYWAVTYSLPEEVPMADMALWDDNGLPLSGPDAFPVAVGYASGDRISRPSRTLLHNLTAILSALASTSEDEMDTGRWTKPVVVGGAAAEIALTLPGLLDAQDPSAKVLHDDPDPRANERVQAEIGRFLRDKEFKSLDEANAAIRERFTGPLGDIENTAATPPERAQDLAYEAFDAVGRRRIVLARRALEAWPDCADAYVIQAEFAATPERALPLYEAGVAAGERAVRAAGLDPEAAPAENEEPAWWNRVETRPYMRAVLGLAETLAQLGRSEEAIVQFEALLRLNPGDNQGVRYQLLGELIRAGRSENAFGLLDRYPDDVAADWMFTRALLEFRAGRREEADAHLEGALAWNEHVPRIVSIPPSELAQSGGAITLGGVDEAIEYANNFGDLWWQTDGAIKWIVNFRRRKNAAGGGRGGKRPSGRGGSRPGRRSRR